MHASPLKKENDRKKGNTCNDFLQNNRFVIKSGKKDNTCNDLL